MCTLTQAGFNQFWLCLQTGSNLRTCVCGNHCHAESKQQTIWDNEKTVVVTIDKTNYVSEDAYNRCKEWCVFDSRGPADITDMTTGNQFKCDSHSNYYNSANGGTYQISKWRYKYDNRHETRASSYFTGGTEIMEKKSVTKKVQKTRTVYKAVKSGGEARHDWVDVRAPTETYAFAQNRIVGYDYNPYTTKKKYVTSYTPVQETRVPTTETYYEDVTETINVPTGRYTERKRIYECPVLTEYQMLLYKIENVVVECNCLICSSFITEIALLSRDATDSTCLVCGHSCHIGSSYCNRLRQCGLYCACGICRCVKCIENTIGPDNCVSSFFCGKDRQQQRIIDYILKNIHPYKYLNENLFSEGGWSHINVDGKDLFVHNIVENTVKRLR